MSITYDKIKEREHHLHAKVPHIHCPACHAKDYKIMDEFTMKNEYDLILKIVPVICKECGNIQFFDKQILDSK